MVASVIALPKRADQKCMRWMRGEASSRELGDEQITLGYSVDGQDCKASLTSAAI